MANFFIKIYDFFSTHKMVMWSILLVTTVLMTWASVKVRYVEDITNFFPKEQNISLIFDNLKAKDRFVVMITSENPADIDTLIGCVDQLAAVIESDSDFTRLANVRKNIDGSLIESMSRYIYNNLPVFLDDSDYERLDSITRPTAIAQKIEQNYDNLFSPIGGYISDFIYYDPLNLGGGALKELQNQGNNFKYKIIDNYIFSSDEKTLICYVEPKTKMTATDNENLVDRIENSIAEVQKQHPSVEFQYFGAPAVAAYNARQIKKDSLITLNLAILLVIVFITLAFRNKYTIFLVLTPVVYGALFALSLVYAVQGEISMIAVGSGSIIFGIALSYSIHILSHTNHCNDMKQLIRELAYPLTVGSFTTIGAFVGLLFTNSKLLQDFGLFSSLTLVGTTLFSLIFLPHFLSVKHEDKPDSKVLLFVDRISNVKLDRNKPLVYSILLLTLICGVFFSGVKFDSNMMNLNFEPPHLKSAEERLNTFTEDTDSVSNVLFIASASEQNDAVKRYGRLCQVLDSLKNKGMVMSYSSIAKFIVPDSVQKARLDKWNNFWTPQRQEQVMQCIDREAVKRGFDENAFSEFNSVISKRYDTLSYNIGSEASMLFPDWLSSNNSLTSIIAHVKLKDSSKPEIYDVVSSQEGIIAADRSFFAGKMAEDVNYNFYLILYISGFLIFFALLLSYGRIELTLISFLPMFISWVVILGIMSLCGIEFNIVTIILSTFIFGIGDDFSIFIMDGLQSEYRDRTKVLAQHKTAIFFSAFTIVVGMGALVFAKHPAMYSLGIISLIGILVVVLVAYTIQPFVFRLLISSQTQKGGFPYTLSGLLNTVYAFGLFITGCFVIQSLIFTLHLMPISKKKRKECVHKIMSWSTHAFLRAMVTTKMININTTNETFDTPAVIIANHQSFIDILLLLGLHPKLVMVTNGWVWRSPFFGRIVRYLDFYHTENGYEELQASLRKKVEQGYSVVVFPEGTRSSDSHIKRFHKGAFYLAEQLDLDIVPVLIYGNGLVSSKLQPFYIKKGKLVSKILPRIPFDSQQYGEGYKEKSKNITRYFKSEYHNLYEEMNRVSNPYFKDAIIKNYLYKGPVIEWYMRIKLRMEKWYDEYDRILPRNGYIVDLGCGYGAMSYMLSMLSHNRRITGVDYDEKKIALANNCFAMNKNIEFIHSDIRQYDIPQADAFVISDVLHYIDYDAQKTIIQTCIDRLNEDGIIIIRDGDSSMKDRHQRTEQTEKWSTQIVKFNKTDGPLCFISKKQIQEIAHSNSMCVHAMESNTSNSNTLFVLTRKEVLVHG